MIPVRETAIGKVASLISRGYNAAEMYVLRLCGATLDYTFLCFCSTPTGRRPLRVERLRKGGDILSVFNAIQNIQKNLIRENRREM